MAKDDPRGCVYVDGTFGAPDDARVSPLDHGFLYGDGAFETMRTYGGRVFRLAAHLARLDAALECLAIAGGPSSDQLAAIVRETLARAALPDAYCRITVTRGRGDRGLDPRGCRHPTVVVAALPLRPYPESAYRDGIAATLLWRRASDDHPPPSVKSTSYQRTVLARIELARRAAFEGFFLDEQQRVTEGTTSNVFVVHDGVIATPSLDVCLAGVTRHEVLSLARELGVPTREEPLSQETLLGAREVFVTSSLAEVLPVVRVDAHVIADGSPGALTRELRRRYYQRALVA